MLDSADGPDLEVMTIAMHNLNQLLSAYIAGDESAFTALIESSAPLVLGACRRICGPAESEDAAQAVFLVLARKAQSLVPVRECRYWYAEFFLAFAYRSFVVLPRSMDEARKRDAEKAKQVPKWLQEARAQEAKYAQPPPAPTK
jgi:DNA-directed RNA polymerase specialized sigma24 family protein